MPTACAIDLHGTGGRNAPADASAPAPEASDDVETALEVDAADDVTVESEGGSDGAAASCDVDNDGYAAKACGGNDCCDDDVRAYPGATAFHDTADACGSFDYDCNGVADREFGRIGACNQAFSCASPGFNADTPCGVNSAFTTCEWRFGCRPEATTRTQRCR